MTFSSLLKNCLHEVVFSCYIFGSCSILHTKADCQSGLGKCYLLCHFLFPVKGIHVKKCLSEPSSRNILFLLRKVCAYFLLILRSVYLLVTWLLGIFETKLKISFIYCIALYDRHICVPYLVLSFLLLFLLFT